MSGHKIFEQELLNGFPSPVYIIYSKDDFLIYDAVSAIKDKYQSDAFNFDIFDAQSSDYIKPIEEILDILNTLPFMSQKRIVVIENAQRISKKDIQRLQNYALNPSSTTALIMFFCGTSRKPFETDGTRYIKMIEINIQERAIPLWIKDIAGRKGMELTEGAIEYLINFVGTDLGMLYSEIEKFSSLKKGRIDVEDIKGMVYAGAEYNAFHLINALEKKDTTNVFRIFESLGKGVEPQMLLGALNWQFEQMQDRAPKNKGEYFRNIFKLLHEADIAIKSSGSYVIEDLLVKLIKNRY